MSQTSHTLDCHCEDCTPLTETQEMKRGQMLVDVLCLHRAERGRYHTQWGSKTPLGIYRTAKRIVEDGQ